MNLDITYYVMIQYVRERKMIKTFGNKLTENFFYEGNISDGCQFERTKAFRLLDRIDNARNVESLNTFSVKLESTLNGQYFYRLSDIFVICFRFSDGDAFDVCIKERC